MCKVRVCIIDYPMYEVCRCGIVYKVKRPKSCKPDSLRQGIVSQHIGNQRGHIKVQLQSSGGQRKHLWVHRVVCTAFHGCPPVHNGKEAIVRHLDSNPANNHADNLRWGTQSENERDKRRNRWLDNTY